MPTNFNRISTFRNRICKFKDFNMYSYIIKNCKKTKFKILVRMREIVAVVVVGVVVVPRSAFRVPLSAFCVPRCAFPLFATISPYLLYGDFQEKQPRTVFR